MASSKGAGESPRIPRSARFAESWATSSRPARLDPAIPRGRCSRTKWPSVLALVIHWCRREILQFACACPASIERSATSDAATCNIPNKPRRDFPALWGRAGVGQDGNRAWRSQNKKNPTCFLLLRAKTNPSINMSRVFMNRQTVSTLDAHPPGIRGYGEGGVPHLEAVRPGRALNSVVFARRIRESAIPTCLVAVFPGLLTRA